MSFVPAKFLRLLNICLALTLGGLFVACLDTPSDPDTSGRVESIKVHIVQNDKVDSTTLKINPRESATLVAAVYPSEAIDNLDFFWYYDETILGIGKTFSVSPDEDYVIPNALLVADAENNTKKVEFNVIRKSAPSLGMETIPHEGDVIEADEFAPIQFHWSAKNSSKEKLTFILEIDKTQYNVGSLTRVSQSGLSVGDHSFRVIVFDTYGDSDTLKWVNFTITDPTTGAKQ